MYYVTTDDLYQKIVEVKIVLLFLACVYIL